MAVRSIEETTQILHVRTTTKNEDAFGQSAHAEIYVKAPFRYIDDAKIETSRSGSIELLVLRKRVTQGLQVHTSQEEFKQQHWSHRGQRFAVLGLMQTSPPFTSLIKGEDQYLAGASILILGSAHEADKWRCVGFFSVSLPIDPNGDDSDLRSMSEMKRAKWEWRDVTIV